MWKQTKFVEWQDNTTPAPRSNKDDRCACVLNHVGISVPDCDAAVAWYGAVFGMRPLKPVLHVKREQFPGAPIFRVFDNNDGSTLQEFKMAWLGTAAAAAGHSAAVGLEIFEFIEPRHQYRRPPHEGPDSQFVLEYARGGFFHVAMTVADPEKSCAEVVKTGGRKLGETVPMPHRNLVVYCQDPWGNAIELLTTSFEQMVLNGAPPKDEVQ
ncbi:Glyoxalase/Bleomycin resistance protein/Dihydroxybiphenyl dioxygenase [Diplogelasinospora grovesii]|uniref:Glyoxalase/Bleomycin resistance protein/Dihydroxybiphenyl dioxygenase n=1 Tax=Diplogelasinospora grovesii TaxID=303347 RepID=A0AAN6MWL7_9PEZI|nr:Glyoxalase/Bleomycin resistance protein/Dihydroxybiphenyl dioxygenase [Diplogelasinospora grovesii]